ncbi:MAG: nucleotidyl transferase AbiEii/AbiGii toxin family protein [Thermoplasmataceae archaeon]
MLTRDELSEVPVDFNLYQKEKDYLQHIILTRIYSRAGNELVFKGGTSLQKTLGLNRFSEDLDFTHSNGIELDKVEKGLEELERFYPSTYEKTRKGLSVNYKVKMEGPLYKGPMSMQTVRIEISLREKVLLEPTLQFVTPLYKDIQPYLLVVMDPKEILSEKIRALMTRSKARDLYDIYFLILKQINIDLPLVRKKLEYYEIKYDTGVLKERILKLSTQWNRELPALVRTKPSFEAVVSAVFRVIDEIQ